MAAGSGTVVTLLVENSGQGPLDSVRFGLPEGTVTMVGALGAGELASVGEFEVDDPASTSVEVSWSESGTRFSKSLPIVAAGGAPAGDFTAIVTITGATASLVRMPGGAGPQSDD
jgi:hypothetical protein